MAEQAASGLLSLGLKKGDKIALVAYKNRPEWLIMDFAIQMAGMISVPLYPTISVGEYEYILNEAEVKAAFCGALDLVDKLTAAKKKVKTLKHIYVFDKETNGEYWTSIFDKSNLDEVEAIKKEIKTEDLATIIYTSGTSGKPSAVMHAHRAIWARRMMFDGWYGLSETDRLLHAGAFNWTFTLGTGLLDPWAAGATALIPAPGTDPV